MNTPHPFQITVTGKAEIPHPAERALIYVSVSSSGTNKQAVSDEVITTAKHIAFHLGALSADQGEHATPEAQAAAPLAHWAKTSLNSTSHIPHYYRDPEQTPPR